MVTKKAMEKMVWFDMDGTIADLYGVDGWLEALDAEDTYPYEQAGTLVNMAQLAKLLHKLQAVGYGIGIISWTSKRGSALYNGQVALSKMCWLHKHLPSVSWDEIRIVDYGTPKYTFKHYDDDILFDDEANNRNSWQGLAYNQNDIINTLKALIR